MTSATDHDDREEVTLLPCLTPNVGKKMYHIKIGETYVIEHSFDIDAKDEVSAREQAINQFKTGDKDTGVVLSHHVTVTAVQYNDNKEK